LICPRGFGLGAAMPTQSQKSCDLLPRIHAIVKLARQMETSDAASADHWVLRGNEVGVKTPELCRKDGINSIAFYNWKAKRGGPTVGLSEAHFRKKAARKRPRG
jgi:hypothetical protein